MTENHFGAATAKGYDAKHGTTETGTAEQAATFLHALAAGGAALEFAIGTGRIARPLARLGTSVSGIELSPDMLDVLRAQPEAASMTLLEGDMTTAHMPGDYTLCYLVFNTIDNLTSQDAQIACFENAARHLLPGGSFVVETLVPPLQRLPLGETLLAQDCADRHWCIDEFDVVTQRYVSHHVYPDDSAAPVSVPFRYAWPAEMDLMARLAGLRPEARFADFRRTPFGPTSRSHVSVWRKATGLP